MLNRLYIVIGVLAILVIAAAFIVPRFIQWGDYRGRMEAIASETLGAPVAIVGDIEFSLLPQPRLKLAEVRVGPAEQPVLAIADVEAEFSLIDFLRDRYVITRLVLVRPVAGLKLDAEGQVISGFALADQVTAANVAVARAQIVDGVIGIADARSGGSLDITDIDGDLRMDALRGPFTFQGSTAFAGETYATRLATSAFDAGDGAQLSVFLRPADERFTLTAEGRLAAAAQPSFAGNLSYTQKPPAAAGEGETLDAGRGDLAITGEIQATPARVLLSSYTIVPDANRAATRLTGAAEVTLGAAPAFNAVISGGVVALPPRDATADPSTLPYELIRLLAELPVPAAPGLAGSVGVDIAELDLRAVVLRKLRLDASTDGKAWQVQTLAATLPGNASLSIAGALTTHAGRPEFTGELALRTQRLDSLAPLWQKPREPGALFNLPGALTARLSLVGETLSLSDAVLTLGDNALRFGAEIGFAPATRHLNLRARLGALDAAHSAALFALLPDVGTDPKFGLTFPRGRFDLTADTLTIAGLDGRQLALAGSWEGGVLSLERVSAADLGGVEVEAKLTAFGSVARPEVSGTARLAAASRQAPAVIRLFDTLGTPAGIRDWLGPSFPADLNLRLDAPSGEGGQGAGVTGRLGAAAVSLDAQLGAGIIRALQGKMTLRLDLRSDDPAALTAQLGLGAASLIPEGAAMHVAALVDGTAANSFETTIRLEGGGESLAFSGNVVAGNLQKPSGNGNLQASLSDLSPLVERLGAGGIWLPALSGSARLDFEGFDSVRLRNIAASAGGEMVAGELHWKRAGEAATVEGSLRLGVFSPTGLLSVLAGPAAAANLGGGIWPDGPADVGRQPRTSTGRIEIAAAAIATGDLPLVSDARFILGWDATGLRLRDFTGTIGSGRIAAELALCCAGPLPTAQLSGRVTLTDVPLQNLVPAPVAAAIDATLDASARFEGTGDSFHALLAAMTGEGTYTLDGLAVRGIDPAAFGAVASLEEVLDQEPEMVGAAIVEKLGGGSFAATAPVSGGFTIAGGVLRSPNLAIPGAVARLFGATNIRLSDLGLSGGFAMTPTLPAGPEGLLTEANASIATSFGGTLPAPAPVYNVSGVVDTIMVRAYEREVARLEELRAADEERQRLAAEERARIAAEAAARQAAEDEARRQAEAERLAAEEAARQQAAEEARRQQAAEEARRRAEQPPPQVQSVPQLQPGYNLNLPPQNFF